MYFIEAGNRELTNLEPAINQPCLGESVLPTIKVSVWFMIKNRRRSNFCECIYTITIMAPNEHKKGLQTSCFGTATRIANFGAK